jgi:hypothetical protein
MIATGTFKMRGCSDLETVKSSKKETEGVRVIVQLEEGPDKGSTIEWIGWLGPNSIERTSESLRIMGFDGEDKGSVKKNVFSGVLEKESYDRTTDSGETVTNEKVVLRWVNDPNAAGGRFLQTSPAESAGIMQRLKAAALAAKNHAKAAVAPEDEPNF